MTLGVVATLKIKPGKEAEFEDIFRALMAEVKQNEPGCLMYELFKSKQPSTYVVMEKYASGEALAAHGKTPHFVAAGPKLGGVLDGRPQIEMLEKV